MVGNALEQEILELYSSNPTALYSINQIATKLDKRYPYINKKVTKLIKKNVFKRTIIGRSHLCSLNLKNDETKYLLILNEITKKKKEAEKSHSFLKTIEYAEKIARLSGARTVLKSNNTIFFIVDRIEDKEAIRKATFKQGMPKQEFKILTREELKELLKTRIDLHQNKTLIYGFENYYETISEIEDDLKIRYSKIIP